MEKDSNSSLARGDERAALAVPPALEMNPADYLPDMDGFDLTEDQKIELLGTLWDIMRRFVEIGVDVDEADPCGQVFGAADEFAAIAPDGVKSSFAKATETQTDDEEENPA